MARRSAGQLSITRKISDSAGPASEPAAGKARRPAAESTPRSVNSRSRAARTPCISATTRRTRSGSRRPATVPTWGAASRAARPPPPKSMA